MTRRPALSRLLLAVLVTASLAGCGGAQEVGPSRPENNLDPPPESTLSYGGRTVTGTLGPPYCRDGGRSSATEQGAAQGCDGSSSSSSDARSSLPPFTGEALVVPQGARLTFVYGGPSPPDEMGVEAVPLEGNQPRLEGPEGRPVPLVKPPIRQMGKEAKIVADLPKGEYGVSVWVANPEGYAYYGFRVLVR